ncbi:MAG TPA: hypothetical protein VF399_05675 [bacterium]
MILLIEPNAQLRKRLADMVSRERIIGVSTYNETLEMLCKFKNDINLIIAYIRILQEIMEHQAIYRLCDRLYIKMPPILALCRKGDKAIHKELTEKDKELKCLDYDPDDTMFPERYVKALRELYPDIIADVKTATDVWLRGDVEIRVVPKEWLTEHGFIKTDGHKADKQTIFNVDETDKILCLIRRLLSVTEEKKAEAPAEPSEGIDPKNEHAVLAKKYQLLVQLIRELGRTSGLFKNKP